MKLAHSFALFFLAFAAASSAYAAGSNKQCPQVDCACESITDNRWRDLCLAREAQVIGECVANQGKPKTFCGMHGPAGFPVATTLQAQKYAAPPSHQDVPVLQQLIATQIWSLNESLSALKNREKAQQFGDAIQVLGLLERDSEKLYALHVQVIGELQRVGRTKDVRELAEDYARETADRALQLKTYSDQLWQTSQNASAEQRLRKAYGALAFKSARLAAATYEYSGDIYGRAAVDNAAAVAWQSAAELAQILQRWEAETENKPQHLEFYQAQAAARWHRATYQWLKVGDTPAVKVAVERAAAADEGTENALSDNDLHSGANGETRAIKRGSR